MAKKKTKSAIYLKIDTDLIGKVRKNKEKTGVPISTFVEQALNEKLSKKITNKDSD